MKRGIEGQIRRVIGALLLGVWITLFVLGVGMWSARTTGQFEFLTVLVGALTLALTAAWVGFTLLGLQRSVMVPLVRLTEGLARYSAGDHGVRLQSDPGDIAELKQIQKSFNAFAEEMEQTLSQLRRVDEERTELTATLTHELRTPLTSIRGYSQLLREGDAGAVSDEQKRFLDLVIQGCDRLSGIVDQFLEMESRESELAWASGGAPIDVEVRGILQECVELVHPLAHEKQVTVEWNCDPLLRVSSDPFRLHQVFQNLISNAVKYNREGGNVRIEGGLTSSNRWFLQVEDTGLGLTESERKALFRKFYRTEDARKSGTKGTGLGLYITRKWVESLDGRIDVESEKGVGTRFRIEFPVKS